MIEFSDLVDKGADVFIYWLVNPINDKVFYVGKTRNPEQRYRYHSRQYDDSSKNPKLRSVMTSIISAGLKPKMRVIDCSNELEWKAKERYWICKCAFDWQLPLCNISLGGNSVEMTPEVRAKISKSRLGKPLSEATKQKMKGRKAWSKDMFGIGKTTKRVEQLTLNGEFVNLFPSIRQACLELGLNRGAMSLVVAGKRGKKTLGGFIFKEINE